MMSNMLKLVQDEKYLLKEPDFTENNEITQKINDKIDKV